MSREPFPHYGASIYYNPNIVALKHSSSNVFTSGNSLGNMGVHSVMPKASWLPTVNLASQQIQDQSGLGLSPLYKAETQAACQERQLWYDRYYDEVQQQLKQDQPPAQKQMLKSLAATMTPLSSDACSNIVNYRESLSDTCANQLNLSLWNKQDELILNNPCGSISDCGNLAVCQQTNGQGTQYVTNCSQYNGNSNLIQAGMNQQKGC